MEARSVGRMGSLARVIGSMVGVGILITPPLVARAVDSVWMYMALWGAGGLVSVCGAVCYAELGVLMPRGGGDAIFQRTALGPSLAAASGAVVFLVCFAASIAAILFVGGPWYVAAAAAVAVWLIRVVVARTIARQIAALPARIDPFALREPWRFFVRDALQARTRFAEALAHTPDGPLRTRLLEIGDALTASVEHCWEAACTGQRLSDARRRIDAERLERDLASLPGGDARIGSIDAQLASHARLTMREESVRDELERIEFRLEEAVVRAEELGTRAGTLGDVEHVGAAISDVVHELEALRLGLDDVEELS